MKRNLIVNGLLVTALAFAYPAYAQKGMSQRDCMKGQKKGCVCMKNPDKGGRCTKTKGCGPFYGDPQAMKTRLGLSDDQVNKISAINLEYKKQFLGYKEKLEPKHIKLEKMLLEDNVDTKEVRALLKEISDVTVDVRMLRVNHQLEIEKVLTPEQKTKLRSERRHIMKKDRPSCKD